MASEETIKSARAELPGPGGQASNRSGVAVSLRIAQELQITRQSLPPGER